MAPEEPVPTARDPIFPHPKQERVRERREDGFHAELALRWFWKGVLGMNMEQSGHVWSVSARQ
jgi:hypothetical protein